MYYLMQEQVSCGCNLTYNYVRLFATPFCPIFIEVEDDVPLKGSKSYDPYSHLLIRVGVMKPCDPSTTVISSDIDTWSKENEVAFDCHMFAAVRRTVKSKKE